MIDWTGDLEAVHANGRIIAVKVAQLNGCVYGGTYANHDHWLFAANDLLAGSAKYFWCSKEGIVSDYFGWTIRNITPATPPISQEIAKRAIDLVERMASTELYKDTGWAIDARAILAALKPEIDPLESVIEAAMKGGNDITAFEIAEAIRNSEAAIAAIAKGRSLERGGE